jgi:hypothetical protein
MTTPPDIQALFSRPPASFAWSQSADGQRTLGTSPGAIMDLWPGTVQLACIMAPDDQALVNRGVALLLLLLAALRPAWVTAPDWLAQQMRMAARAKGPYEGPNYSQRVEFRYDKQHSRAVLKVVR